MRRRSHRSLRRRYGRSRGAGYVEARMSKGASNRGLWDVLVMGDGGRSTHVLADAVRLPRERAITCGQREAKERGLPFVMGI